MRSLLAAVPCAVSWICFLWSALSEDILPAAAGQVIRIQARYAASSCPKDLKSLRSCPSQFTHRVPRLSWENTMRISPMRRALRCWKRLIRVEVRSWPRRLRSSHFLYIRSVQITHWREVLSSLIPSLSSVWTRMATWCLRMKC